MPQFEEAQSRLDGCFKAAAVAFLGLLGLAVIFVLMGNGIASDKGNHSQPKPRVSNPSQNNGAQSDYGLGTSDDDGGFWTTPDSSGCKPLQYLTDPDNCRR